MTTKNPRQVAASPGRDQKKPALYCAGKQKAVVVYSAKHEVAMRTLFDN